MADFFDFKDLDYFLAWVLFKYFEVNREDIPERGMNFNFLRAHLLKNYEVVDRCKCNQLEYNVCGTVYLKNRKKSDFFENGYFIYNSNMGIFIFHVDEYGSLGECELLFKEGIAPEFLPDLVKSFPSENLRWDKGFLNEIEKLNILSVEKIMSKMKYISLCEIGF